MELEKFKFELNKIAIEISDTYYGSILAQFKMIILTQEFILKNPKFNEQDLLSIYWDIQENNTENNEAKTEAFGEIYTNLLRAHKNKSIFDDYGQDRINDLFRILNLCKRTNSLFSPCNE